jgi:hypothetical protein
MALCSRCSVHAAELYVVVPPSLFLTCQRIRGECQPNIRSMSQKVIYLVGVCILPAVSSRGRSNSANLRNVQMLSDQEGASWIADSSLRLHFLFLQSSNLVIVIAEQKARGCTLTRRGVVAAGSRRNGHDTFPRCSSP